MGKVSSLSVPKEHLTQLVKLIPFRMRATAKPHIEGLQQHLKLPFDDLVVDRRTLRRLPDDPGRLAFQESMKARLKVQPRKTWIVEWRDGFGPIQCTLDEAAKMVNRPPHSLRCILSKKRGVWHTMIDEQLVTVRRAVVQS